MGERGWASECDVDEVSALSQAAALTPSSVLATLQDDRFSLRDVVRKLKAA